MNYIIICWIFQSVSLITEWASWSGWSGCDCVSCGTIGRQTRSRSCSDPALETYGNNDFCSGPNQQFRECTMDTELCNIASPNQTDNNCTPCPVFFCSILAIFYSDLFEREYKIPFTNKTFSKFQKNYDKENRIKNLKIKFSFFFQISFFSCALCFVWW